VGGGREYSIDSTPWVLHDGTDGPKEGSREDASTSFIRKEGLGKGTVYFSGDVGRKQTGKTIQHARRGRQSRCKQTKVKPGRTEIEKASRNSTTLKVTNC